MGPTSRKHANTLQSAPRIGNAAANCIMGASDIDIYSFIISILQAYLLVYLHDFSMIKLAN
jgi:hypothetical protein